MCPTMPSWLVSLLDVSAGFANVANAYPTHSNAPAEENTV